MGKIERILGIAGFAILILLLRFCSKNSDSITRVLVKSSPKIISNGTDISEPIIKSSNDILENGFKGMDKIAPKLSRFILREYQNDSSISDPKITSYKTQDLILFSLRKLSDASIQLKKLPIHSNTQVDVSSYLLWLVTKQDSIPYQQILNNNSSNIK